MSDDQQQPNGPALHVCECVVTDPRLYRDECDRCGLRNWCHDVNNNRSYCCHCLHEESSDDDYSSSEEDESEEEDESDNESEESSLGPMTPDPHQSP